MPKLFKPKIGGLPARKIVSKDEKVDASSRPVSPRSKSPVVKQKSADSYTKTDSGDFKEKFPARTSAIQEKSPVKLNERDSPRGTDVDIDAVTPGPSQTDQPDSNTPLKLFTVKQQPRRQRVVYGDVPPPTDKPLDRSSVTLRALLNWVPTHKPPPKIRDLQLTPDRSKSNNRSSLDGDSGNAAKDPKPSNSSTDLKSISDQQHVDPFAPQVRLDADGNIVLDEGSLVVQRPEDSEMDDNRRHVAEEAGLYGTTYNSFRRRPVIQRGRKWSEKDTTRFYRALSTIGTDFYCMTKLFPDRSRTQLLKKYKREERLFPHLVDDALKNKRNYDVSAFYNSESDKEEEYERMTQDAIKQKRKAVSKTKAPKDPKKHCACDLSLLIEEVLAQGSETLDSDGDHDANNSSSHNTHAGSSKTTRARRGASLAEMIDHTAKRVAAEAGNSVDLVDKEASEQSAERPPPSLENGVAKSVSPRKRGPASSASQASQLMAARVLMQTRSTLNL